MHGDVQCPYCEKWVEINHDDGYGYSESELHQQECDHCEKTFGYTTSISYNYDAKQVDCLNDGEHQWKFVNRTHKDWCIMRCSQCEKERKPTKQEFIDANWQEFQL